MQPPMTPLTERMRIEAEQNILSKQAEMSAQGVSPRIALRDKLEAINRVCRALRGIIPSWRYGFHVIEKFDESDQTSYS